MGKEKGEKEARTETQDLSKQKEIRELRDMLKASQGDNFRYRQITYGWERKEKKMGTGKE